MSVRELVVRRGWNIFFRKFQNLFFAEEFALARIHIVSAQVTVLNQFGDRAVVFKPENEGGVAFGDKIISVLVLLVFHPNSEF